MIEFDKLTDEEIQALTEQFAKASRRMQRRLAANLMVRVMNLEEAMEKMGELALAALRNSSR